jgi:hypothetical protein
MCQALERAKEAGLDMGRLFGGSEQADRPAGYRRRLPSPRAVKVHDEVASARASSSLFSSDHTGHFSIAAMFVPEWVGRISRSGTAVNSSVVRARQDEDAAW